MADTSTGNVRRFTFTGQTIEELRKELQAYADEQAKRTETELLVAKGVQLIPVDHSDWKIGETPEGLVFLPLAAIEAGANPIRIVCRDPNGLHRFHYPSIWATEPF